MSRDKSDTEWTRIVFGPQHSLIVAEPVEDVRRYFDEARAGVGWLQITPKKGPVVAINPDRVTYLEAVSEGCRSGRTDPTANQVQADGSAEGSNPSPSATCYAVTEGAHSDRLPVTVFDTVGEFQEAYPGDWCDLVDNGSVWQVQGAGETLMAYRVPNGWRP